jgi:hypothetical protein
MEIDLRVRFREIIGDEIITDNRKSELHTTDDYPLSDEEQVELKEALVGMIKATTLFTGLRTQERLFVASVSHANTKY